MAQFILKDSKGKAQTFDHETIYVRDTNGELVQFTQGEGDIPAVVQPLEVTENGTYTAPDGVDGYSPVTVNVAGSGGGLESGLYWRRSEIPYISTYGTYKQSRFVFNGKLYAAVLPFSGSGNTPETYLWNGTAWTKVVAKMTVNGEPEGSASKVLYNGKIHCFFNKYHDVFDGTSYTSMSALPNNTSGNCHFVLNGKLMVFSYSDGNLYEWDEATDTWSVYENLGNPSGFVWQVTCINGILYRMHSYSNTIDKWVDGTWTTVFTATSKNSIYGNFLLHNNCLFFVKNDSSKKRMYYGNLTRLRKLA